jgi:hypothetical protein
MILPNSLVISSRMGPDWSSTERVHRGPSEAARCASTEDHQAPSPPLFREQEDDQPPPLLPKLARSILSRTVVTAAAGIRALLGPCPSEAPRPVLTGGAACSTFRSTMSRNGTSGCAKRRFTRVSNRALALAAAARLPFRLSILLIDPSKLARSLSQGMASDLS